MWTMLSFFFLTINDWLFLAFVSDEKYVVCVYLIGELKKISNRCSINLSRLASPLFITSAFVLIHSYRYRLCTVEFDEYAQLCLLEREKKSFCHHNASTYEERYVLSLVRMRHVVSKDWTTKKDVCVAAAVFFLYTAVIVEITPPSGKVIFPRVDEPILLAGIDCATLQSRQSINLAKALWRFCAFCDNSVLTNRALSRQ